MPSRQRRTPDGRTKCHALALLCGVLSVACGAAGDADSAGTSSSTGGGSSSAAGGNGSSSAGSPASGLSGSSGSHAGAGGLGAGGGSSGSSAAAGSSSSAGSSGNGGDGGNGGGVSATCTPSGSGFQLTADVAVDKASCLAWQRQSTKQPSYCPSTHCWAEAGQACSDLSLGGHSDWRLPTIAELKTIVVPANYPAVDVDAFPATELSMYWSSEPLAEKIQCLDFSNAGTLNEHIGPDGGQAFRCVRGGAT